MRRRKHLSSRYGTLPPVRSEMKMASPMLNPFLYSDGQVGQAYVTVPQNTTVDYEIQKTLQVEIPNKSLTNNLSRRREWSGRPDCYHGRQGHLKTER